MPVGARGTDHARGTYTDDVYSILYNATEPQGDVELRAGPAY